MGESGGGQAVNSREIIENELLKYPVCEYAFGSSDQIPFSDRVWTICEQECERYGHCWACPPLCGKPEELMAKCRAYTSFCLFSTVTETADTWSKEADLAVKKQHEALTRSIRKALRPLIPEFYVLSAGCAECEVCTCPDEPCRHPASRLSSMESHGIVVMQLTDALGLTHQFGRDTVVYFSMILFNESSGEAAYDRQNQGM